MFHLAYTEYPVACQPNIIQITPPPPTHYFDPQQHYIFFALNRNRISHRQFLGVAKEVEAAGPPNLVLVAAKGEFSFIFKTLLHTRRRGERALKGSKQAMYLFN